ncbi:transcriptional regulator [Marinomonas agarivorans]|nr:transcriptional regulator [Marinomonas agarivorans]
MISCQQYDYIEIACLFRLPIELTLHTGEKVSGVAQTTSYNQNKEECLQLTPLLLTNKQTPKEQQVPKEQQASAVQQTNITLVLNTVASMQALEQNPHFDRIDFQQ